MVRCSAPAAGASCSVGEVGRQGFEEGHLTSELTTDTRPRSLLTPDRSPAPLLGLRRRLGDNYFRHQRLWRSPYEMTATAAQSCLTLPSVPQAASAIGAGASMARR